MISSEISQTGIDNWILASLSEYEFKHLAPYLEPVTFPQSKTLYLPEQLIKTVYFPNSGMISLISITQSGETIEVGMVGNEGMVGIPVIMGADSLPYQAEVQVAGEGLMMRAEVLADRFKQGGALQELLLRYTVVLIAQLSQSAVCNRFHTVCQRLCKWLLITRDRVKSNEFSLTQEDLSYMMGSHRPNVTVAARGLQNQGLIRYYRGKITVLDEQGLELSACECYQTLRDKFQELVSS